MEGWYQDSGNIQENFLMGLMGGVIKGEESRMTPVFGLSNWKNRVAIYCKGKTVRSVDVWLVVVVVGRAGRKRRH